ncbi:MAG: DUF4093 domain-containing protein [Oscillospiraceae bacterium]|nr:DUF4093 domain-containing protein [Oscillospiraceae bacterium]
MHSEKIYLRRAVIVEGRYDKIRLESVIEAMILPVGGFQIFTDKELRAFIRRLAAENGIIVLTDSDAAGFKIRAFLRGMIPPEQITHVYIPDIFGREKRKAAPSKEGKLGVEGMSADILREAFRRAGVTGEVHRERENPLTKLDLYEAGLTGGENSREKRFAFYARLGLPARLGVNAALPLINQMLTREEFEQILREE